MPARRILLLGDGDLTDETAAALAAAGAQVVRLEDPAAEELGEALAQPTDAVAVVSRDDAWPLRAALLVRHLDADVPIIATIFDPATGRELEQAIGSIAITSLAEVVAPSLAGPCLGDDIAAVLGGEHPTGLRYNGGKVELAPLPELRARRLRALSTAILQPFDRSAGLVFFGAVGLALILVAETVAAAFVLALAARSESGDLRVVLRAGSNAIGGETKSLERLGHVRDVHRIGAVYIAGLALGSAAAHVVVDGDTAHLRGSDGALERCEYPVAA